MNNNLALATSQSFGNVSCDFWQDTEQKEFYMTRDQIGTALEYTDPRIAISKIHAKHKDRLDRFSTVTELVTLEGNRQVSRDITLYSSKGMYEICRWSRQTKADEFMDWVWKVIDNLRTGEYRLSQNNITLTPQAIEEIINNRIGLLEQRLTEIITESKAESSKPIMQITPIETDPVKAIINPLIQKRNDKTKGGNNTYRVVYKNMGVSWSIRQTRYRNSHRLTKNPSKLTLIRNDNKLLKLFQATVNQMFAE